MRGEPFSPDLPGCGGFAGSGLCNASPTWYGQAYFPQHRRLWRAFACNEHKALLDVARPLDDDGRAELERRRERRHRVIVLHERYLPEEPLATGRDARERLERARAWAAEHDGWGVAPIRSGSDRR